MVPDGWKTYKLGEISDIIGGGTPTTSVLEYWDGNISWITPKDLTNYQYKHIRSGERSITELGLNNSSTRLLPRGAVLLTSRAPIGYLAIAENQLCTNQGFKSFIAHDSKVNNVFLYYLLKNNIEQIKSRGTGTTFAEVSGSTLKDIELLFPESLSVQNQIASVLSSLDDKIELNLQMNKTLESINQAIFKEWFIDFRFPEFDGLLVDGLPKGWRTTSIGKLDLYITDLVANGSFASIKDNVKTSEDHGYALFLRNTDLKSGFRKRIFVDELSYTFLKKSKLFGGELILSNVGDIGSVHLCPSYEIPMTLGNNCIMVRSDLYEKWLYLFFKSEFGQHKLKGAVIGSVQEKLSKTNFKKIELMIPPKRILDEFNHIAIPILQMIELNIKMNDVLSKIRDSLMPKLMTGKIRVA